jgi:hypothetical protein
MRKLLLLLAFAPFVLFASGNENKTNTATKIASGLVEKSSIKPVALANPTRKYFKTTSSFKSKRVGTTFFDQQTNAAMARKISVNKAGKVSCIWTYSNNSGDANFTDRGSNYVSYDPTDATSGGGAWTNQLTNRLESDRAGYNSLTSMVKGGVERDVVVAHRAKAGANRDTTQTGGLFFEYNDKIGGNTWTTKTYKIPNGPMWPRSAGSGKYVHIIAAYPDYGDTISKKIAGIRCPVVYIRYNADLDSFEVQDMLLPNYDLTNTARGVSDVYSIDAKGDTVAILIGGEMHDVMLFKSLDAGKTWTKKVVSKFKHSPVTSKTTFVDTPFSNNGSLNVTLDKSGIAHCFFGRSFVTNRKTDGSYSYFITDGIVYYNDRDTTLGVVAETPVASTLDTTKASGNTAISLINANNKAFNVSATANDPAMYVLPSLSIWPTAAIDNDNTLYLFYSACNIERVSSSTGVNFRDIYFRFSKDQGKTWSPIDQLTQKGGDQTTKPDVEYAYPCVAKNANNGIYIFWQQDNDPGNYLTNKRTIDSNFIYVGSVTTADIQSGNTSTVGIDDQGKIIASVTNVYPNPAVNGVVNISMTYANAGQTQVTIVNSLGQTIKSFDFGKVSIGPKVFNLNTQGISSGLYFIQINVNGQSVSRTVQIQN